MLRAWWTKRRLRSGLRQYRCSVNDLNKLRDKIGADGRLPENLQHLARDLLSLRRQWLSRIEHLEASRVLSESEAVALKRELGLGEGLTSKLLESSLRLVKR